QGRSVLDHCRDVSGVPSEPLRIGDFMIPVHDYDENSECEHCKKTRYGAFKAEVQNLELALCFRCLATFTKIFKGNGCATTPAGSNGRRSVPVPDDETGA